MGASSNSKPAFLNVDLEIESTVRLDKLVAELGKRVLVLHFGPGPRGKRHFVSLEVHGQYKNPDATIHAFCNIIEKLTRSGRKIWKAAEKEFNVGFELRSSERISEFSLQPKTLKRISQLGAGLAVTYYNSALITR